MGWREKLFGDGSEPDFVRVAVARNQPESELLLMLLRDAGIPACFGRTRGFDVPDMLAAGPRDILVPAHFELDARDVLQPVLDDLAAEDPDASG